MQPGLISSSYAPPNNIVIKYFIAAIFSFLIANILLVFNYDTFKGFHFQPKILAITHIITLGWITMIIFGALYQFIPVVLEAKLFSKTLSEMQFWIFLFGVFTQVYSFWFFLVDFPLTLGASLINLAVIIFLINIIVTLTRVKQWDLTATFLSAALFYLLTTAAAGLLLAINLGYPYIKGNHLDYIRYHLIIAVAGWILMIIMPFTLKWIDMSTTSPVFSNRMAKWSFGLTNAGLVGYLFELHVPGQNTLFLIFSLLTALGILVFLFHVFIVFRQRIRRKLDPSLKFTAASFVFFVLSLLFSLLLLFIDYTRILNITLAFGYVLFFGFISMIIIGQIYKIFPFLAWYTKYGNKPGVENVPLIEEMYDKDLSDIGFYLVTAAVIGVPASVLLNFQPAVLFFFLIMLAGILIFVFNVTKIILK